MKAWYVRILDVGSPIDPAHICVETDLIVGVHLVVNAFQVGRFETTIQKSIGCVDLAKGKHPFERRLSTRDAAHHAVCKT